MSVNIEDYIAKKEKNLVSIQKIADGTFAIHIKQFSPMDGSSLDDLVVGITLSEITDQIELQQAVLSKLQTLSDDLSNA